MYRCNIAKILDCEPVVTKIQQYSFKWGDYFHDVDYGGFNGYLINSGQNIEFWTLLF
jgi:hypothetical protein